MDRLRLSRPVLSSPIRWPEHPADRLPPKRRHAPVRPCFTRCPANIPAPGPTCRPRCCSARLALRGTALARRQGSDAIRAIPTKVPATSTPAFPQMPHIATPPAVTGRAGSPQQFTRSPLTRPDALRLPSRRADAPGTGPRRTGCWATSGIHCPLIRPAFHTSAPAARKSSTSAASGMASPAPARVTLIAEAAAAWRSASGSSRPISRPAAR